MPTEPKTFKTHTPNPRNPKHAICGLFRGYYELTDDEIGRIITQMCEHASPITPTGDTT